MWLRGNNILIICVSGNSVLKTICSICAQTNDSRFHSGLNFSVVLSCPHCQVFAFYSEDLKSVIV